MDTNEKKSPTDVIISIKETNPFDTPGTETDCRIDSDLSNPFEKAFAEKDDVTFSHELTSNSSDSPPKQTLPSPMRPSLVTRVTAFVHEWTPFMLVVSYFIVSVCLYLVCSEGFISLFWFFYLATNFYVASMTVIEAFLSIAPIKEAQDVVEKAQLSKWSFPTPDKDLKTLDLIIVAYLPNEKDIIVDRVLYLVNNIVYPRHKITIRVLYNTPKPIEPLESNLFELADQYSNLRITKVPNSTSKADNLNYYLSHIESDADVVAIYDCDHYPHPNGPRWAMERFMSPNVDIVQGRCVIFNAQENFLTKMIAVEFDKIYAVSHPGRSQMWGFGLFCGSNGYWRADLLRELKMDGSMLTEDIDSALRAFPRANAVHDMNVISFELAPTNWASFWKQRLRWAQGWTQASGRHLVKTFSKVKPDVGERPRSLRMRMGIFSLLFIREWSYYLVTQMTCLTFSFLFTKFPTSGAGVLKFFFFQYPVAWWLFFITVICLISTLWITFRVRSEFTKRRDLIMFSVFYPVYLVLSAIIGLYGHARQVVKYSSWNPTARS